MDDALGAGRTKLRRLLRAIRRERGVTQVELSERSGLAQAAISNIERGERRVEFVEVEVLCEAVGMSLRSFCRRWDSTPDDWGGE